MALLQARTIGQIGQILKSTIYLSRMRAKYACRPFGTHIGGHVDETRILSRTNHFSQNFQVSPRPAYPVVSRRFMAYDSSNKVHQRIHDIISKSKKRVFLFMKGIPSEPACGYSKVVVQIFEAYGVEFESCNVLEDDNIRQEIKNYSDWPTIPQVYIDGSFVGGCDILLQMHQSGELEKLFDLDGEPSKSSDK